MTTIIVGFIWPYWWWKIIGSVCGEKRWRCRRWASEKKIGELTVKSVLSTKTLGQPITCIVCKRRWHSFRFALHHSGLAAPGHIICWGGGRGRRSIGQWSRSTVFESRWSPESDDIAERPETNSVPPEAVLTGRSFALICCAQCPGFMDSAHSSVFNCENRLISTLLSSAGDRKTSDCRCRAKAGPHQRRITLKAQFQLQDHFLFLVDAVKVCESSCLCAETRRLVFSIRKGRPKRAFVCFDQFR